MITTDSNYKLLTLCQEYAPTRTIQQNFANLYNEMKIAGESELDIAIGLVNALHDSLAYGNWP